MSAQPQIVLASESPRRRALLAMLGVEVTAIPANIDEGARSAGLEPIEAVQRVAHAKVHAVDGNGLPVLAADTIVALGDAVLGKPTNRDHAVEMLRRQSGRQVQVISCVVVKAPDGSVDDRLSIATLSVAALSDTEITAYLDSGEADDKAGALAVQGGAGTFVTVEQGTRSNVVGLPLRETTELLRAVGVQLREGAPLALGEQ